MSYLLKNCILFDPLSKIEFKKCDIKLSLDKIEGIYESYKESDLASLTAIDMKNRYIFPGFIDVHTHFRDPGFTEKEDIVSGSHAALHGGYTTCYAMPNTKPPLDTITLFDYIRSRSTLIDIYPVSAVTVDRAGKDPVDFFEFAKAGITVFTDDGSPVANPDIMYKALKASVDARFIVMEHALYNDFFGNGMLNDGEVAHQLKLPGLPDCGESSLIFRDIELAALTGGRLHLTHVSTAESVRLILQAKKKGLPVTFDVTPHHLLLNDESCRTKNALYKVSPPLRSEKNRSILSEFLIDNKIDMIATDHAPHTREEKMLDFAMAPFGMTGLETSFIMLYTEFVASGKMNLSSLLNLFTHKPANAFNLNDRGSLKKGKIADIVVFNPLKKQTITESFFKSKSSNSPFIGKKVQGSIDIVFKKGKILFDENGAFHR